uniref:Uncharacterized protein n=1 Tax=Avena sativa TaxID=4498 RepID=A0ACD5ZY03_AVESA
MSGSQTGDKKRKVLSIFGFGGLGKTTLAMEVCRRLDTVFQRQAQVSVSQAFDGRKDLQGLLQRVLQQIAKPKASNEEGIKQEDLLGSVDKCSVDELAIKLKVLLTNKRYLIVIDDVWTTSAWSAIISKLPENNCHSRIIVTTRIESVAKACSDTSACGDYMYKIEPLKGEDPRRLFTSIAFGSMNASCPVGLEVAMGDILKKCGGLPLAIVSIGGLLANYNSSDGKDMWERISKSLGSHMESHPSLEGLSQIVAVSFNNLPYHLKGCMMYSSIFPEDYVVEKKRLLSRWIAEGLVMEKRGLTQMEVAEACFDDLVSRGMIIRSADIMSNLNNVSRESCQVHDILLEVLVSKCIEANFASLAGGPYAGMSYNRIRRLSVHGGQQGHKDGPASSSSKISAGLGLKNGNEEIDVRHVRSLSMFDLGEHKLLDQLGKFTLLRVLDLEDSKGVKDKHMGDICRMYLMRFLSLKGTDISFMPPEVGKLEHLQTLDVSETQLAGLPESVTNLHQLERLLFSHKSKWDRLWVAPTGLSKMKALREASRVVIKDNVGAAKEIGDLEQLLGLFVYLDDSSTQYEEVRRELAGSLCRTNSLRWLIVGEMSSNRDTLDYLFDLSTPPPLLRFLRFAGGFSKFPEWVGSLTHLVEFTISWGGLSGDQLFDVLYPASRRSHSSDVSMMALN